MAIPLIGGIIKGVLGIGEKVIDKVVADKDLKERLKHELRLATQDDNQEFRVLVQQSEAEMFKSQQETIQAELHQNDLYTKRTRPKIARHSFYAGLGYVLVTSIPTTGIYGLMPWQFEWQVLILLYSPALSYMGVRGLEKWKAGGSK